MPDPTEHVLGVGRLLTLLDREGNARAVKLLGDDDMDVALKVPAALWCGSLKGAPLVELIVRVTGNDDG